MPIDLSLLRSPEFQYIVLVVGLFIVPRVLQRYRLPTAITCVVIGLVAGKGLHAFEHDSTVPLLATLGIVSLFLFAGLEVEFDALKRGADVVIQHVVIQVVLLGAAAASAHALFDLPVRQAILLALAIVTPSTGFILDSIGGFGLSADQQFWVKSKAIAVELVALAVLFLTVQSGSWSTLLVSAAVLVGLIAVLPPLFRVFAARVVPYAPKSEFAFLVIVALVCAAVTRKLGVYYLVGAFIVGVTAQRFRRELPAVASEKLLGAVELFASFFVPFYFFKAGLHVAEEPIGWMSVGLGLAFILVVIPIRIGVVALHRMIVMNDRPIDGVRVGTSLVPTLVFTIVISEILRERFGLRADLFGALLVFTLGNTLIPSLTLRPPSQPSAPPATPMKELAIGPTEADGG